jgi:hypothetical protein
MTDNRQDRSFVLLRRHPDTERAITRILELPNHDWTELRVEFGIDELATATLTMLLTPSQLAELVTVATTPTRGT